MSCIRVSIPDLLKKMGAVADGAAFDFAAQSAAGNA